MQIVTRPHLVYAYQRKAHREYETCRKQYWDAVEYEAAGCPDGEVELVHASRDLENARRTVQEAEELYRALFRGNLTAENVFLTEFSDGRFLLRVDHYLFKVHEDDDGWYHTVGQIISVKL